MQINQNVVKLQTGFTILKQILEKRKKRDRMPCVNERERKKPELPFPVHLWELVGALQSQFYSRQRIAPPHQSKAVLRPSQGLAWRAASFRMSSQDTGGCSPSSLLGVCAFQLVFLI